MYRGLAMAQQVDRGNVGRYLVLVLGVGMGIAGCGGVREEPADAGPVNVCTPNALACGADNAVYQCNADGTDQTKIQDCQFGCATDHCKECEANTTFCDGDNLVTCSADGTITNPQTCADGCQLDRCNTCTPSTMFCDGANAVTCGADGTPASTTTCGAAGCLGGVCNSCTPNTTSCQGDTLVVCNANGMVQNTTSCALGCAGGAAAHCKQLVPSYGVGIPSGTPMNLVADMDGSLNIATCSGAAPKVDLTVGGTTTTLVAPQVSVVTQVGSVPICVVRFGTITVSSGVTLSVSNNGNALSLQATGDIAISGLVTFANSAPGPSPGVTVQTVGTNSNNTHIGPGAGGGGAARAGGSGGICISCGGGNVPGGAGGAAVTNILSRLNGGSSGGYVNGGFFTFGFGGRGGGALQLVSLTRVTFGATGAVALNGEGGTGIGSGGFQNGSFDLPAGGGGSGGTLVVEAPVVSLSAGALAVANGAGGAGGCFFFDSNGDFRYHHPAGQPGQLSDVRAAGGDCPSSVTGDGGAEATGATSPSADGQTSDSGAANQAGGGGGGSNGFVILRGRAATSVTITNGAIVSPAPSVGAVTAN